MTQRELSHGLTFDAAAIYYDRYRPRYPHELFDAIGNQIGLTSNSRILEVGCGPGQVTEDLIERGWNVLAVEPGARLAQVAREKFDHAVFDVEVTTFDELDSNGRTFDLLFPATDYHWVHPSLRWVKAAEVLTPCRFIALATNRTLDGATFNEC